MRGGPWSGALLGAVVAAALLAGCGTPPVHASARPTAPVSTARPTPVPPARSAGEVRVVGLGDSVTSGEHCDCDDYVSGFAHLLASRDGVRVRATDDGESGSTSAGLAHDLAADPDLRADVARADVVMVTTGANDLTPALSAWHAGGCSSSCSDRRVAGMEAGLDRVLDRVRTLSHGHARVLVTTYWNVFTDGEVARKAERPGYLAWSDGVTRQANAAITRVATAHSATLVDLYTPFKGDGTGDPTALLAADGDHPDAAGTALISRTVLATYAAGR